MIAGNHSATGIRIERRLDSAYSQCGIALEADVQQMLLSEPLFARLTGQLGDLLGRGFGLSLRLSNLCSSDGNGQFEGFCRRLSASLDAPGSHNTALAITLPAGGLPPDDAWNICQESQVAGSLNIICDDSSSADDGFWLRMWRLRREPRVRLALWPLLRGPSPLLPSELAGNVEPCLGLQVPTESAWLSASLSLPELVVANAALDEDKLMAALTDAVSSLDAAHDCSQWPTPAMQQDAWLNRRLAVQVEGIGDAVDILNLDPMQPATAQTMLLLLRQIRDGLKTVTRRMTHAGKLLPAIDASNPLHGFAAGPVRDRWEERWQRAVARGGVRHRNLLALSPWALFPRGRADQRYFGLLGLLGEADSCLFGGKPSLADWNVKDFKHFYQSLWAVRRQVEVATLVAERL